MKFITETLELGARVASMKLVIINQWVQFPPDQSPLRLRSGQATQVGSEFCAGCREDNREAQ